MASGRDVLHVVRPLLTNPNYTSKWEFFLPFGSINGLLYEALEGEYSFHLVYRYMFF